MCSEKHKMSFGYNKNFCGAKAKMVPAPSDFVSDTQTFLCRQMLKVIQNEFWKKIFFWSLGQNNLLHLDFDVISYFSPSQEGHFGLGTKIFFTYPKINFIILSICCQTFFGCQRLFLEVPGAILPLESSKFSCIQNSFYGILSTLG